MQSGIPPCIPVISPDDGHVVARIMYRKEINILRKILHQAGFIYKITARCYLLTGFMKCSVTTEEFQIGT
jgi:hypothetical protein